MPYDYLKNNPGMQYALIIAALLVVAAVCMWLWAKARRDIMRERVREAEAEAVRLGKETQALELRKAEQFAQAAADQARAEQLANERQLLATREAEAKVRLREKILKGKTLDIDYLKAQSDLKKLEGMIYRYNAFVFESMTGLEFESFFADLLRRNHYQDVSVTRASGDHGGDVLATDLSGERICFQCKDHASDVGVSAVQEVFAASKFYNCDRGVVIARKSFTRAARELAENIGVILLDGAYVSELMELCIAELQTAMRDRPEYYRRQARAYADARELEREESCTMKPFAGRDECAVNLDQSVPNYTYYDDLARDAQ